MNAGCRRAPFPENGYAVRVGDAQEILSELPRGIADTCIASPPYWGLRDYGVQEQLGLEASPEEYVARLVDVLAKVRRVLRSDGTLWLNLGDCHGCRKNWQASRRREAGRAMERTDDAAESDVPSWSQTKGLGGNALACCLCSPGRWVVVAKRDRLGQA